MSGVLPEGTPRQARAVTLDDGLITVEAGAGTGKTWVLSSRFARLLLTRACLPQNILTLTFTEAAAREMQERIRRVFESAARPEKNNEKNNAKSNEKSNEDNRRSEDYLRSIEEGFDEAWISTIHSFASRVIRESGLSLDVDPRSGVVGAPQEEAFWGALETALEELSLTSFARLGSGALRKTAALLERDEALLAALEKWGPSAMRALAQSAAELHASLGGTYETFLTWADDAERAGRAKDMRLDPQAYAASQAVQELLEPRWAEAWSAWREIFSSLRNDILAARDKAMEKDKDAKRANPAIHLAAMMEKWSGLMSLSQEAPSDENLSEKNLSEKYISEEALSLSVPADAKRAFYAELCSCLSSDNSKLFKAVKAQLGQSASKWRGAQEPWDALSSLPPDFPFPDAEQRLRAALLRLSGFAWGAWDAAKRRMGLLSFSDMIRFAAESIRRDARTKGFSHILVDEFQDTDPLQDSMIRALRAKEGASFFLVGDPKQAIYRFRHADLTLFADYVLQSRAGAGADITLDVSFRTRAALLEPLNSLFARIWRNGLGAGKRMESLKFEPLSPAEPPPERELGTVPPFTLLLSVKKGRGGDARERLDTALARSIAGYVNRGRTVWDKTAKRLRPARWRDFAVLTPTRTEYEVLEAAFEAEGIPVSFEKSKSYFSRGEVVDVINTLRAAAFPDDETALAGWLASPFSGAAQTEAQSCLEIMASAASGASARKTPLIAIIEERLPGAAERLAHMRRAGCLRGPSAALSFILEDRRWLSAYDASIRPRVIANVNRAAAVAREYESGVSPSLAGCARWLDTALRADSPAEEPEWLDENSDTVRVMTVHASKGLEFPVVAVMRTESGPMGRDSPPVAASKTMGVAVSGLPDMMKREGGAENANAEAKNAGAEAEVEVQVGVEIEAEAEEKPRSMRWENALSAQSELEESARLFYVASTRAQDSLILCGIVSEDAKGARSVKSDSWLSWTLDWIAEEHGDWRDFPPPIVEAGLPEKPDPEAGNPAREPRKAVSNRDGAERAACGLPEVLQGQGAALESFSATSFALFEWCPFAWRRRHRQGLDLKWEIPDGGDAAGGSKMGSLAHWILARWNMREASLDEWLGASIDRRLPTALRETWRSKKNRDTLREWLSAFAGSAEGRALADLTERGAAAGGEMWRESSFSAALNSNGSGVRLAGAADVLWRDGGLWHVRDYKITLSNNAPAELYRAQLAFYALAVKLLAERRREKEECPPFEGVDVGLVFLREGGKLGDTRAFSRDSDWEAAQNQIASAARAAAQGPWIPKREHCRRCPWRPKCPRI